MTVLLRLDPDKPETGMSGRSFATPAKQSEDGDELPTLADVVRRVRGARRIVVVCGAGVSTAAAIPDFRSARGLFTGAKGHAVKDLFHVKSLSSAALLPDHHALLTDLCERTFSAQPTQFHQLLASIDADGRLLRCYTQNIDGLEERAGLRTGVPPQRKRARRGKERAADDTSASVSAAVSATASASESVANTPSESGCCAPGEGAPPTEHEPAPRCIPLHGLLRDMHCSLCSTKASLSDYLPLPPAPISCPGCDLTSSLRSALSERQRRVGSLRASVVLYGEEHPEGELIGSVVERDLKGTGRRGEREGRLDMLIVAGTSLAIPGVKRMVKEMGKALSARPPSSVRDGKAPPVRTVLLNAEPPAKPGEWDGVFDAWVQGDVQQFASLVADPTFAPPVEMTKTTPKKKAADDMPPTPASMPVKKKPRAPKAPSQSDADTTPTKKPRVRKAPTQSDADTSPSKKPRARKAPTQSDTDATPTKKPRVRKTAPATDSDADATPIKKKRPPSLPLTPRPTPPRPRAKGAAKKTPTKRSRSSPSPSPSPSTSPNPYIDLPDLPGSRSEWAECRAPPFPTSEEFSRSTFESLVAHSRTHGDPYVEIVVSPTHVARARFSPPPPIC